MKNIVVTCLVVSAAFGLASASMAQVAGPQGGAPNLKHAGHEGRGGMRLFKLNQEVLSKIGLTPAQAEQSKELTQKLMANVKELWAQAKAAGPTADKTQFRQRMRDLHKGYHEALFKILTPDQQKAYGEQMKALIQKMREEHKHKGKAPQPTPL